MSSERNTEVYDVESRIVSPAASLGILAALLAGTGLSIWSSFFNLGVWNLVIVLAIALVKTILVILFFMHVKHSSKLTKLALGCCAFTILILFSFSLMDFVSRAWGQW